MDAYCTRCKSVVSELEDRAILDGVCPACQGQLSYGGLSTEGSLTGAVAMTFVEGSRVAIPLDAEFVSHAFSTVAGGKKKGPPPAPIDDEISRKAMLQTPPSTPVPTPEGRPSAPLAAPQYMPPASDEDWPPREPDVRPSSQPLAAAARPNAKAPATLDTKKGPAVPNTVGKASAHKALGGVATMDDEQTTPDTPASTAPTTAPKPREQALEATPAVGAPPALGGFDFGSPPGLDLSNSMTPPSTPLQSASPSDTSVDLKVDAFMTPRSTPVSEPTPPFETAPSVPAHLALPSIDFSMPDYAMASVTAPGGGPTQPSTALPAHLQLPNFPDFSLPPIPGAAAENPSAEAPVQKVTSNAGSVGAQAGVGAPAPVAGEPWTVEGQARAVPAAPPPLKGPPPVKARPRPPAPKPAAAGGLGDLPALGLPSLSAAAKPKDPTLIHSDAAMQMVADLQKKRSVLPIVLTVVLIAGALVAGGLLFGRDIVKYLKGPEAQVVKTARQQADDLHDKGLELFKNNKIDQSIAEFSKAVEVDPAHAEVHRSLAIAYAKLGKPEDAVQHYEKYLELAPNSPEAATVRKFVDDYRKAQTKNAPPEKGEEKAPEKGKGKRR